MEPDEAAARAVEEYLSNHQAARVVVEKLKLNPEDFYGKGRLSHNVLNSSRDLTYGDLDIVFQLVRIADRAQCVVTE